jgi:hypothetical protein
LKVLVSKHETLAAAIADVERRIDAAAEAARGRFLTLGAGQTMEYMEAHEEARRYQEAPDGEFPMLQADVDAGYSATLAQAAASVLAARALSLDVGARIRSLRLTGKHRVRQATSISETAEVRRELEAQFAAL